MGVIYRLEEVKWYRYDKTDEENVEDRRILGHFSSIEKLLGAVKAYISDGIKEKNITISTFHDNFRSNQKYVYVLYHQYAIKNEKGQYIDYDYIFRPFSNREKCIELKNKLKNDKKYAFDNSRLYDIQPPDGFYISKEKIDYLYGIPKERYEKAYAVFKANVQQKRNNK